ncbi:MAG: 5-(carboxyamino)imidazole ribonucleotide mutase [Rubrobacteraceae bacterium]
MPAVGILVGSKSDLPTMEKCTKRLEDLGVEHELEVLSAHRNPEAVAEYVATAPDRGIKVFICAAGMAAHLAGAVAARTNLPVIGVPIAAGTLGGFDALLATVQMPTGVPVATVAVGGAANAAVLAAQILALGDPELVKRLEG